MIPHNERRASLIVHALDLIPLTADDAAPLMGLSREQLSSYRMQPDQTPIAVWLEIVSVLAAMGVDPRSRTVANALAVEAVEAFTEKVKAIGYLVDTGAFDRERERGAWAHLESEQGHPAGERPLSIDLLTAPRRQREITWAEEDRT